MKNKLEQKVKKCGYSKDKERTVKLMQRNPELRFSNEESLYQFCVGCDGSDDKCPFYYTGDLK